MYPGTTAGQHTWPGHSARGAVIGKRFARSVDYEAGFGRAGGSGACATTLGSAWRFSRCMHVGMRWDVFLAIAAPPASLGGIEICPDIDIENGKIWSDMERTLPIWKDGLRPTSR